MDIDNDENEIEQPAHEHQAHDVPAGDHEIMDVDRDIDEHVAEPRDELPRRADRTPPTQHAPHKAGVVVQIEEGRRLCNRPRPPVVSSSSSSESEERPPPSQIKGKKKQRSPSPPRLKQRFEGALPAHVSSHCVIWDDS